VTNPCRPLNKPRALAVHAPAQQALVAGSVKGRIIMLPGAAQSTARPAPRLHRVTGAAIHCWQTRPMRKALLWLSAAAVALLAAAGLALALALQRSPSVPQRDEVSTADIDRAVALLRQHDPRRLPYGQLRVLALSERDADLLVLHAARRWLGARTQLQLRPGRLQLQASVPAPYGRWLNLQLGLRQTDALPTIEHLQIGRLPLPAALALPALRALAQRRGVQADALLALRPIERVSLAQDHMLLGYRIEPDTAARLRAALVAPEEQQRLRAYHDHLAALTQRLDAQSVSLAQLMPPLFSLAAERSAGGDAAAENRAALRVLAFFANQRPLGQMLPAAYDWPRVQPMIVTLRQRQDLALHFLVSAVVAAEAGTPLADAVGLWKELADARDGGSGFSFDDLAADRAGTRLGELAVHDAARLQARIAAGVDDGGLMPPITGLAAQLSQKQFAARYGSVGSAAYNRVLADIDARVQALPVLQ
jgi:hypothetical protein